MKNPFSLILLAIVSLTLAHSSEFGPFAMEFVKMIEYPNPANPTGTPLRKFFFRETAPSASYDAASARCLVFGYRLAIVDTKTQLDEVKKFTTAELPNGAYWLGARREENFRWENNALVNFNELEASQDGLCLTYNLPGKTIGSSTCGTTGKFALCSS